MGIKSFSKTFEYQCTLTYKDLSGETLAIDAMYQLHRFAHPFKTTNQSILTAPDGKSTNHINGILALIFNLYKSKVKQYWIFDNAGGHDSIKDIEVEQRRARTVAAKQKLQNLDELFSDSDEEVKQSINKYERAAFTLETYMVTDLKFILDCFDVPWIESPEGYEAEQIAARMTQVAVDGVLADGVMTPDPDCLLFGAKAMIKNDTASRKLQKYNLDELLQSSEITLDDLIKIGVVLGCDFAKKTPGIGPKTVLKKFKTIKLTADQSAAIAYFAKPVPNTNLTWSHRGTPFSDEKKIKLLSDWMVNVKGFNRDRTSSRFDKGLATK